MDIDLSAPMIGAFKTKAKALRDSGAPDAPATHAAALEEVAHLHGARDWNTLHARASRPVRLSPGLRVTGQYLGQPFEGQVHALSRVAAPDRMRVTLQFDTPVDVVTFDSFSTWRSRVTATIGPDGRSVNATSNGVPHLVLEHVSA